MSGVNRMNNADAQDKDSWMEMTKGGSRTSEYTEKPKKKKKDSRPAGNIAEVVRERANRYKK